MYFVSLDSLGFRDRTPPVPGTSHAGERRMKHTGRSPRGVPMAVTAGLSLLLVVAACTGEPKASNRVVAIDPGHPSETSQGASGPGGATEIQVNWAVALKLQALLEGRGYDVILTKLVEEEVVTNRHRAEIGTFRGADIMVRLHCDAGSHRGTATFFPDRQGTRWGVTGPAHEVIEGSRALAEVLHPAMVASLGPDWPDLGIKGDSKTAVGARQGALTGSIFSEIPVVTIEMVVITDEEQEAFIASETGQDRMAEAIAQGIGAYFERNE